MSHSTGALTALPPCDVLGILGSAKELRVSLSSSHMQPQCRKDDVFWVSIIGFLVDMQCHSAFSLETEELGWFHFHAPHLATVLDSLMKLQSLLE